MLQNCGYDARIARTRAKKYVPATREFLDRR
jgi:hypothetical protein